MKLIPPSNMREFMPIHCGPDNIQWLCLKICGKDEICKEFVRRSTYKELLEDLQTLGFKLKKIKHGTMKK